MPSADAFERTYDNALGARMTSPSIPVRSAGARHHRLRRIAARRRPGEPGRDAGAIGPFRHLVEEARATEELGDHVGGDVDLLLLSLGDLTRHLPDDRRDLPVEVPDAGLTRVGAHDLEQRIVVDREPAG